MRRSRKPQAPAVVRSVASVAGNLLPPNFCAGGLTASGKTPLSACIQVAGRSQRGTMQLRYLGFDQLQNARAFRFDIITKGEVTKHAVVTADLALFLQHHVGIQDGPTLCASKLSAD